MAKNATSDWDTTAANNTDVGGVNIDESCAAANINNAIREVMAQIATGIDGVDVGANTPGAGTFTSASADNFYVEPGGATGGGAVAQFTTNGDDIRIVPTDGAGGYDADNWFTYQYTNGRWAFAGNVRFYGGIAQESGEAVQLAGATDSYVGNETTGQGVSVNATSQLAVAVPTGAGPALSTNRVDDSGNHVGFFKNGSSIAFISESGGTITYGTGSDYRIKENVTPLTGAIDRLSALKPSRFNLVGYERVMDGFIAHELQEVIPEAVTGEKDEVDGDGNPVIQNVDYAKVTPLLVAALQEAIERIEALEAAE